MTILLIGQFALTACGGKMAPRQSHEEAQSTTSSIRPNDPEKAATPEVAEIHELNKTAQAGTFLASAKQKYLDIKNWKDAKVSQNEDFFRFINEVHKQQLQLPTDQRWAELKEFYLSLCGSDLKGCELLRTLKTSPYAAVLLGEIASTETNLDHKYRLLLMAFDVSNQQPPQKNVEYFLADIQKYMAMLEKSGKTDLTSQLNGTISIILSAFQEGRIQLQNVEWIATLPLLTSKDLNLNALAGTQFLAGKTDKNFRGTPLEKQAQEIMERASGHIKRMAWLNQNFPQIVQLLKLQTPEQDAYFFIVDQIMSSRWTAKQGASFFAGAKLEVQPLDKVVFNYLMSEIGYVMGSIQYRLKENQDKTDKRDLVMFFEDGKRSLFDLVSQSKLIPENARRLSELASLVTKDAALSDKIDKFSANYEHTAKIAFTFPSSLALFDMGLRMGIEPNTKAVFSKYNANGAFNFSNTLQNFLRGSLIPLMDFSEDLSESNIFSMTEAMDFAVQSGIFETLGTTGDEAMARFLDSYMQSDMSESTNYTAGKLRIATIRKSVLELAEIEKNSKYQDILHMCKSMKTGDKAEKTVGLNDFLLSPVLGNALSEFKAHTMETLDSGGTTFIKRGFFPFETNRVEYLEWLRLDILPRLSAFSAVLDSSGKANKGGLPKFQERLQFYRDLVKQSVQRVTGYYRRTNDCWFNMMEKEIEATGKFIVYEKAFWKWALEQRKAGQDPFAMFKQDLPKSIKYRGSFDGDKALLYSWDIIIRARYFMMYGIPALGLPPIIQNYQVILNDSIQYASAYRESKVISISTDLNADEFATKAIQGSELQSLVPSAGYDEIKWYKRDYYADASRDTVYLQGVATLFRLSATIKTELGDIGIPLYSEKDFVQDHQRLMSFSGIMPNQMQAMKILGIRSTRYEDPRFLLDKADQYRPYMDYALNLVAAPILSFYANAENAGDKGVASTPTQLVPAPVRAKTLYYYMLDRQEQRTHAFTNLVKTPDIVFGKFAKVYQEDTAALLRLASVVREQKPVRINMEVNKSIEFAPYKSSALTSVLLYGELFNSDTGGIFKTPAAQQAAVAPAQ